MKIRAIISFLLFPAFTCLAQVDPSMLEKMDSMLVQYVSLLEEEPVNVRSDECTIIIDACPEGELREHTAQWLFNHYESSPLMGDEAVAIDIYDKWFANGLVKMKSDEDKTYADIFAEFNRSSLIGVKAPRLELEDISGSKIPVPSERMCVLYFYSATCSKCNIETILLRNYLESLEGVELDFIAIYTGTDRDEWEDYVTEKLDINAQNVRVFHLWDPERSSDFERLYGVVQTPRMFLVDASGVITGRRLDTITLKQLIEIGRIQSDLYSRCPIGEKIVRLKVPATYVRSGHSRKGTFRLSKGDYVIFHTEGCALCRREIEAAPDDAGLLLVNIDEIFTSDRQLSEKIFASFDLTHLPHIVRTDKRGRVIAKYVTFYGKEKQE